MRRLASAWPTSLVVALAALAGCQAPRCSDGTLLIALTLPGAAAAADALEVSLAVDGATTSRTVARAPGATRERLELTFGDGYPAGRTLTLGVVARAGDQTLAAAQATVAAAAGCTALALTLDAAPDGGADTPDGDACVPLTACPTSVGCGLVDDGCGGALDCGGTCQLTALAPPIAGSGATVTLEGTFSAEATVIFPGGATQAATVLGPHRAQVSVPDGASSGLLTVATGGQTVGPQRFRRASFALGLGRFDLEYPQASGPRPHPMLPVAHLGRLAWQVDEALFLAGGLTRSEIDRGTSNADGTVSGFSAVPDRALVVQRELALGVTLGRTMYAIGGLADDADGGQQATALVERATVASDGSLSAFELVDDVHLATPRFGATSAIVGPWLYVLGGTDLGGKPFASVERAAIAPDGSLGPFELVAERTLATARRDAAALVVGSWLYVVGGSDSGTLGTLTSLERAAIEPDGSLGPFALVDGVSLSTPRSQHSLIQLGDGLYAIAGGSSAAALTSVERASIGAGGSLSTFQPVAGVSLHAPRAGAAVIVSGNQLHVIGGYDTSSSTYLHTVEQAEIVASGELGAFATAGLPQLVTSRYGHAGFALGRAFYVLGGTNNGDLSSIERAGIDDAGALGSFAAAGAMVSPRFLFGAVPLEHWVYAFGRVAGSERASIAPDGTLGSFAAAPGVDLASVSYDFTTVAIGRNIYVIGGIGDDAVDTIERAPINADGTLGTFQVVSGVTLSNVRYLPLVYVGGGYLYVLGGGGPNGSGSGPLMTVERSAIDADGGLAGFTQVAEAHLAARRLASGAAVVGSWLYVFGGANNATGGDYSATVERAPINADGTLGSFALVSGKLASGRRNLVGPVIDNALYLLGGLRASGGQIAASERTSIE